MERTSNLYGAVPPSPDLRLDSIPASSAERPMAKEDRPRPGVHGPAPDTGLRLFVVHAPEDTWFVEGFLLAALGLPNGDVLVSSKLELGAVIVQEIGRAHV